MITGIGVHDRVDGPFTITGFRNQTPLHPNLLPHLDPIERFWGLMHKHITHNKCHETSEDLQRRDPDVPARGSTQELAPLLR